jgi:hypothetical protein
MEVAEKLIDVLDVAKVATKTGLLVKEITSLKQNKEFSGWFIPPVKKNSDH